MSIIVDALKKAQKDKTPGDNSAEQTSGSKPPLVIQTSISGKGTARKREPAWLFALILVIVMLIPVFLMTPKGPSQRPPDKSQFQAAVSRAADTGKTEGASLIKVDGSSRQVPAGPKIAPAPAKISIPASQRIPSLKLDGVMYDSTGQGKSFAVINNSVLSEGEMIEDAKLIKIDMDSVSILVNDQVVSLKISR